MKRQSEDFDFGFSFVDDDYEEVKIVNTKLSEEHSRNQEAIEDLRNRLNMMYASIVPFLDNLCKNPDKSTIHWPNRVEKIQAYKKKLQQIAEGKING
jgi:hypothetical protein